MALVKCKECGTDISTDAKACPKCGAKQRRTSAFTAAVVIGIIGWIALQNIDNDGGGGISTAATRPEPPDPRKVALEKTTLRFAWQKGGFNNVMLADFTIKNGGPRPIKDILVRCHQSSKSGTMLSKTEETIYDVVPAGKTKIFRGVNMGLIHSQADASDCAIKDLVVS